MKYTPTRILLGLNALALVGVAALWVGPDGQIRNSQWAAPAAIQPELATTVKVENAQFSSDPAFYTASLERPLFSPNRRGAPAAEIDKPAPVSEALSQARIFGLISGDSPIVLMRAEGKILSVKLNQNLGDWVLTEIGDREATFTRGAETRVLKLEYASLANAGQNGGVVVSRAEIAAKLGAQQAEMLERQNAELEDREARVAAMRAKMSQSKPKKP